MVAVTIQAQMLRRPIIVLSVADYTDMHGATLQKSDFQVRRTRTYIVSTN